MKLGSRQSTMDSAAATYTSSHTCAKSCSADGIDVASARPVDIEPMPCFSGVCEGADRPDTTEYRVRPDRSRLSAVGDHSSYSGESLLGGRARSGIEVASPRQVDIKPTPPFSRIVQCSDLADSAEEPRLCQSLTTRRRLPGNLTPLASSPRAVCPKTAHAAAKARVGGLELAI